MSQENDDIYCPISTQIMQDPVITNCGHSFEQEALDNWMQIQGKNGTCPICREIISSITPNGLLAEKIQQVLQKDPNLHDIQYKNIRQQSVTIKKELIQLIEDNKPITDFVASNKQYIAVNDWLEVLFATIKMKKSETLRQLIDIDNNFINTQDSHNRTMLSFAVIHGDVSCCNLLINKGADCNEEDKYGYTLLHDAVKNGNIDIVRLLIEAFIESAVIYAMIIALLLIMKSS